MIRSLAGRNKLGLGLPLALVLGACGPQYAYSFQVTNPGVKHSAPNTPDIVDDADLEAEILVDSVADAIQLSLTNKTDQVLQIDWANVAITRPAGKSTTLRPDTDLGWLAPGAHVVARLFPFALPRKGHDAEVNEGKTFQLTVPATVRRESKVYRYALVAHVRQG